MIEARISTGDLEGLRGRIGARLDGIQHAAMVAVAFWLQHVIIKSFSSQSSPEGESWTPLSPAYLKRKRGGWMLQESGDLLEQAKRAPAIKGDTVIAGSTLKYAAAQQFGFEGDESVRRFIRRVRSRDRFGKLFNSDLQKETRRIVLPGTAPVLDHTRHMKIPARPYLPTPETVQTEGTEIVKNAVAAVLNDADSGTGSG